MSKVLKTVAMVVGAVALVATGVGAIGIGLGGAASVFGVSASTLFVASAGLSVASGLLAKKPVAIGGGSQTEFSADPRAGVPYMIGRTGTKGSIILRRSQDAASDKTPNDLMDLVVVLSGAGPIEGIESFSSDKTIVSFDGSGNAIGTYAGFMYQKTQLGACPEASALALAVGISANPTGWTAAHKLSGLAAALWRLRYDSKGKHYQNGVPDPMWVAKGVRVYDPRQDSTYPGGSGPCRWYDENTWVWAGVTAGKPAGSNPFLHGLSWGIGRHQNGKRVMGLGAAIDQIIVSDFVEGANIADVNGWTVSGVIYSRPDPKWAILKLMLQAGAAEPLRVGSRIGCRINTPRVSLATITQKDIVGKASLSTTQPKRARINTVFPRFRSEAHDWQVVPADPVIVAAHVTMDGDERSREIEYPLVPSATQAAQLARYDIEDSREFGPGTFPLKPEWMNYKGGDCLTLDLPDTGAQKILVMQRDIDPADMKVTFTVRSETDGKHAFALGQTGTPPPTASVAAYDPSVAAPDATDWSVAGATLIANGASIPAIVATGALEHAGADAAIWDYRVVVSGVGAEANWIGAGTEAPTVKTKQLTGLMPGTSYEVSVRYRVRGVIGARRVLGPVTAGLLAIESGVQRLATQSVAYPLTSNDNSVSVAAFTGVTDIGETIAFPSATLSSLASGTTFGVFWSRTGSSYSAVAHPATTEMASANYVFLGWQATSTSGAYPAPSTIPSGYRGLFDLR